MTSGAVPPHNLQAEESLLGAMLLSRDAIGVGLELCKPEHFYSPAHGFVFEAISELRSRAEAVDAVTVSEELERSGRLGQIGGAGKLIAFQAATPAASNAAHYARIVRDDAALRRLVNVGNEIVAGAYAAKEFADELVGKAELELSAILADLTELPDDAPQTLRAFMAESAEPNWLVPGLLEKQDRVIVTASEGAGKSTLLKQIAVCVASGVHPFTVARIEPRRCLIVDVENSPSQIRKKMAWIVNGVNRIHGASVDLDNLFMRSKIDGINLLSAMDQSWFYRQIERSQAEIVLTGPIYKLQEGDINAEEHAKKVAAAFDGARERFGCAIVIEAHSPYSYDQTGKRVARPNGSSVWSRWPEFGYCIRPTLTENKYEFHAWRGPRDEREWPEALRRGGSLPWLGDTLTEMDLE